MHESEPGKESPILSSFRGKADRVRIFDSHFHIIDRRFPLVANDGFLPDEFTCEDYLDQLKGYDLLGGALVSGSFQAFGQSYLLAALATLGPSFVGVTQLPVTVNDEELLWLHRAGVRALRFNLRRGGSEEVSQLDRMARRVHELCGWHVELYVDSSRLEGLFSTLAALPAVSIDHLGLSRSGLGTLLKLAEGGVRVKASGFGRVDFEAGQALREIFSANPGALMFGSDLPSTRAPSRFSDADVLRIVEALGEKAAESVLWKNAATFYGINRIA